MEKKNVLSKIKLNQLSKNELDKRAMNTVKGGVECSSKCPGWPGGVVYSRNGY